MRRLAILALSSLCLLINAQNKCETEAHYLELMQKYPEYALAKSKVNVQIQQWINNSTNNNVEKIILIPVVVHVVWNSSVENISDAQIYSQIDVLNKDFRKSNIDQINTPATWQNIAADCEIEFCLATIDPNGNTTTGITRTQTNALSFAVQGDAVKSSSSSGIDAWDNNKYLNIWVCNLAGGVLGYATPPVSSWAPPEDGVVVGYENFGTIGTAKSPYHKGRTTTHEIGHWLNLEHLWGAVGSCGDDQVADTPKQETQNFSCPSFPHNPNACGTSNQNGDMYMNFMDYTNDGCMTLFTLGQKQRMIATINQFRTSLYYNNCNDPLNIPNKEMTSAKIVKVVDILGRTIDEKRKNLLKFFIYESGIVEKRIIIE